MKFLYFHFMCLMKKPFLTLAVLSCSALLQAGVQDALSQAALTAKRNQVQQQFQQAYDNALACRQAVQSGRWNAAIQAGTKAQQYHRQATALAEENNIKIYRAVIAPDNLLTDPFVFLADVYENVLFAQVISGKISMQEAVQQGRQLAKNEGLLGAILGENEKINAAYMDISEAFRSWKGCPRAIESLGQQAKVNAQGFCQPEF